MRRLRVLIGLAAALALPAGTAHAVADDPWVAYVANRVVTKQGQQAPVILRAEPATGALVEVSRNGPQGSLFTRPYDLAATPRGDALYVVDMGEFDAVDGRVIRVDPASGAQTLVSEGGRLVDPAGIAVAPDGTLFVLENVGAGGDPEVLRVNPSTGAQSVVTSGGMLCYPFGIALEPGGSLIVTDRGSETGLACANNAGAVIRVAPGTGEQTLVSKRALPWGELLWNPFGVTVTPSGEILVANENPETDAVIAVNPQNGVQTPVSPNTDQDVFAIPQRPELLPDGNLLVSDFVLADQEGGLVHVTRTTGAQSVFRQSRELFNNPLGLEVVVNRPPTAALAMGPAKVAGGQEVRFDASGSKDPEGLGLRYDWDLDGNGSFETGSGTESIVTKTFASSTTFTPRVRVTDVHGAQAAAGTAGPLEVDAIAPVLSGFGASVRRLVVPRSRPRAGAPRATRFRLQLSEAARVDIEIGRGLPGVRVKRGCVKPRRGRRPPRTRRCTRWRTAARIARSAPAGVSSIRFNGRSRGRPLPAGRYRARAIATDSVGNRSRPRSIRLRIVNPKPKERRRRG